MFMGICDQNLIQKDKVTVANSDGFSHDVCVCVCVGGGGEGWGGRVALYRVIPVAT